MRATLRSLLLFALIVPSSTQSSDSPLAYRAADPTAPEVTAATLFENDRFWPYRAALRKPLAVKGREKPIQAGTLGIVVRIHPDGTVRVDFGRDGKYAIPTQQTDLLSRANRIRLGKMSKLVPNFVHAVGPRLLDTAAETLRPVDLEEVLQPDGFLAVFAPRDALPELSSALAPLEGRGNVTTVLFAQGDVPDVELWKQLRGLGWKVPFLRDSYAEGYTRSRLADGTPLPTLVLQTPDGRVLFRSTWRPDLIPSLTRAIDEAFEPNATN